MTSSKYAPKYTYPKDLAVKKGVNGLGLFAKVPIKKGDCIIEYVGEIITEDEANRRGGKYLFQTGRNRHIDGKDRSNTARYINHSCRPNAESEIRKGQVFIFAIKNIQPGEEIFYDYGPEYFKEYIKPKGCGCTKCTQKREKEKMK